MEVTQVMEKITHTPRNSVVFVTDIQGGEVPSPEKWGDELVHASSSCVCIRCYPEIDGETELTLTSADKFVFGSDLDIVFDGVIDTPSKEIMISDPYVEGLLQANVPDLQTRIRVGVDHPRWPQKVVVVWG